MRAVRVLNCGAIFPAQAVFSGGRGAGKGHQVCGGGVGWQGVLSLSLSFILGTLGDRWDKGGRAHNHHKLEAWAATLGSSLVLL